MRGRWDALDLMRNPSNGSRPQVYHNEKRRELTQGLSAGQTTAALATASEPDKTRAYLHSQAFPGVERFPKAWSLIGPHLVFRWRWIWNIRAARSHRAHHCWVSSWRMSANHRKSWASISFYSVIGCCYIRRPIKLIGLHSRQKQLQHKRNGKCVAYFHVSLKLKETHVGLKSSRSNNISHK